MRTKQSKKRLISIDITDRLSPKGRSYAGFVVACVGWRRVRLAALANPKWHQSPAAVLETFFDPNGFGDLSLRFVFPALFYASLFRTQYAAGLICQ
jgi:hypothetical protein